MTNTEMITKMFDLQEQLNTSIRGKDWREQNLNWNRAIWTECAELLESVPWKWWKQTEPDVINQYIELVDIYHFGMSQRLQINDVYVYYDPFSFKGDCLSIIEFIASEALSNSNFPLTTFYALCTKMGLPLPDLYKLYMGKHILNKFRQDHGYKEGYYRKIWGQFRNEDNTCMYHMVKELGVDNIDQLYDKLDTMYHGG